MDDQGKDHIDPEGPNEKNHSKQQQTNNLPTDDVENINSTNKRRDVQLANKPWTVPRGKERMPQMIQQHRYVTLHRSAFHKREQDKRKILARAWIDNKKAYDMAPQSWIINCLKMYKISDEVVNFIEKP